MRRFLAGFSAGLILTLGALAAVKHQRAPALTPADNNQGFVQHILVLGVDKREGDAGRSDAILLVRLQTDGVVRVLAIPRDTLVTIAGHGEGKANSAYVYGGPDLSEAAIGSLLGVQVEHHVKLDLDGFREIIDLMGGVTVDIKQPMQYSDPTDHLEIDLTPGSQRLNGERAEQFVRYRNDAVGDDVTRIHRQQEFLRAAVAELLTPANLARLPQLVAAGARHIDTDLPPSEQIRLASRLFAAQRSGAVLFETLPGHGDYLDGISYFLPDPEGLSRLLSTWSKAG